MAKGYFEYVRLGEGDVAQLQPFAAPHAHWPFVVSKLLAAVESSTDVPSPAAVGESEAGRVGCVALDALPSPDGAAYISDAIALALFIYLT